MSYQLYGDGIHDDYPAIQEMLDSLLCEVVLPIPKKCYRISKTLKIRGNQTLRLPRFATIRLMDGANCEMLENEDFDNWNENICVDGGIWDANNKNQMQNPYHYKDENGLTWWDKMGVQHYDMNIFRTMKSFPKLYFSGDCMRFCRVKNLVVKNVTIKNPVLYGIRLGHVENFSVSHIVFDYKGSISGFWNMDGLHLEGGCKNGRVVDIKGVTHDDLVAVTSDDGLYGPIENILIDGLFAENAHSAVRILSHGVPVKNVTVRNVYGSYYVYCIGITHAFEEDERGVLENIVIDNVAACTGNPPEGFRTDFFERYAVIRVQFGLDIDGLSISNVNRVENNYPAPLFKVDKCTTIKNLRLRDIYQKNEMDVPVPFIEIDGDVEIVSQENLKEI